MAREINGYTNKMKRVGTLCVIKLVIAHEQLSLKEYIDQFKGKLVIKPYRRRTNQFYGWL